MEKRNIYLSPIINKNVTDIREDWLKDADGVVIECEDGGNIDPYTLVSVTPLYTRAGVHLAGGQRHILLKEALKINKRQIAKGQKLIDYLNSRIGKKVFDNAIKLLNGDCPKKCCDWCEGR